MTIQPAEPLERIDELISRIATADPHDDMAALGGELGLAWLELYERDGDSDALAAGLRRPIIGYAGFINEHRIDAELVRELARRHPDWTILFVFTLIGAVNGSRQRPGSTRTFGFAGRLAFDTTSESISAISTSHSWRTRCRKRSSV